MKIYPYLWISTIFFLFSSCGKSYFFDEVQELPEAGWAYTDTLNFEVEITDTAALYNLALGLTHTKNYPYQNIYFNIHTKFPDGSRPEKRVSIDFANNAGKWYGDCSGETCTVIADIQKGAYFNQPGIYRFTIEQFTRNNPLKAIKQVRFFIEDTGYKK